MSTGNEYQDKLLDLINKQPYELTRFKKFVRIDKLLCFEMEQELLVNPNADQHLFNGLTILITNYYWKTKCFYKEGVLLDSTMDILFLINEYQGFMLDEQNIIKLTPTDTAPRTLEYILVRKKLMEILDKTEL